MTGDSRSSAFIEDFVRDIPRGVTSRPLSAHWIPQARWQPPDKILGSPSFSYDPANPGPKILIGALGDKLVGIADNRHILTLGGSRGGKSVTLVSNALFYRGSMLATDPKGELANITAQRRADLGQRVHILDPLGIVAKRIAHMRCSYNFMAILKQNSPTIVEDAELLADGMVIPSEKDPHWDESAKNFLSGVILHVATHPGYESHRDLVTVRSLINRALSPSGTDDANEDVTYFLEEEMLENAERLMALPQSADIGAAIEGAANDFYDKSDRERDSVLSTARRHTKFLDFSGIRAVTQKHDFDLADLKRGRVSLYLCIPASRLSAYRRWLRLFVNQLLAAMEQEKTVPEVPVLACLDEFPVLGYMKELEDAAGQIASFHVKLWIVMQDWGQGQSLYKERAESFLANAGVFQCFANNDLATTEYLSRRLGKTTVVVDRSGEVMTEQRGKGLTGQSGSDELHDLLSPEEISRLFARGDRLKRQLVFWAGHHPLILQRVEYFDRTSPVHAHFAGKYAPAQ